MKWIRGRWVAQLAVAVLAIGTIAYAVGWAATKDQIPAGTVVMGENVGGLTRDAARGPVAQAAAARVNQQVTVKTRNGQVSTVARDLGVSVDVEQTLDRLLRDSRGPWDRLTSLFGARKDVAPATVIDQKAFNARLDKAKSKLELGAVEGGVKFSRGKAVPIQPVDGMAIDRAAAAKKVSDEWLGNAPITLPEKKFSPTVTKAAVDAAVRGPAAAAVSANVVVVGQGQRAVIEPISVGRVLSFVPDGNGGLKSKIDRKAARAILEPQLVGTEREASDATVKLSGGTPTVVPSQAGRQISWNPVLDKLGAMFAGRGADRYAHAKYIDTKPKYDTESARKMDVREVIGEFTTSGFSSASGVNIRLVAQQVDGAVIRPGETFSLNGYTGPRGSAQGYVESGIINQGRPDTAVGGGISQFATTLYNASYFAGMEDVSHTEHAYYISRYPAAREATVFEGSIDLVFRNASKYGALIETSADSSSVTVRIWGRKTVDVESIPGSRYAPTSPETISLPAGSRCMPSSGIPGFTTSDTRVIRDAATGAEISRTTRTVKYSPEPIVRCG